MVIYSYRGSNCLGVMAVLISITVALLLHYMMVMTGLDAMGSDTECLRL